MGENPSYWAVIPAPVRYDKYLTQGAKLLYGEISVLTRKEGYCWATNSYFSELYGVTNKTISNWINMLCDRGYIKSTMKYKENSKEIEQRRLYMTFPDPMEISVNTYKQNLQGGMEENVNTPMEENVKDNNTSVNNINNIKKEVKHKYGEYQHVLLKDSEYEKLNNDIPNLSEWIRKVDEYCQMNNKTYSDYNLVIRNWSRKEFDNKKKRNPAEPKITYEELTKNRGKEKYAGNWENDL